MESVLLEAVLGRQGA